MKSENLFKLAKAVRSDEPFFPVCDNIVMLTGIKAAHVFDTLFSMRFFTNSDWLEVDDATLAAHPTIDGVFAMSDDELAQSKSILAGCGLITIEDGRYRVNLDIVSDFVFGVADHEQ